MLFSGGTGGLAISLRRTVVVGRHRLGQLPGVPRATAVQARLPGGIGSAAGQGPYDQGSPRAAEFPSLPAARRAGSRPGPACCSHDHTVTDRRCRAHISAVYRDGSRAESPATLEEALRSLPDETSWAWIGLYRPSETELLAVAEQF